MPLPTGRTKIISQVQNPSEKSATISLQLNHQSVGQPTEIPAGKTLTVETPLPSDATDICVGYKGDKQLVILQTAFQ